MVEAAAVLLIHPAPVPALVTAAPVHVREADADESKVFLSQGR